MAAYAASQARPRPGHPCAGPLVPVRKYKINNMGPKKQARKPVKRKPKAKNDTTTSNSQPSTIAERLFSQPNRLDTLFSSQSSTGEPAPTSGSETRKRGSRSTFEEDEGFFYKRSKPFGIKKSKQVSTPVSKLHQVLGDLPMAENPFDSMNFNVKTKDNDNEVVKLSSPIRPRYGDKYADSSSDEYVEQVSHHKINLTGGEDDDSFKPRLKLTKGKSKRRESYKNRGKRILSVGNGFKGVPHDNIDAKDYYKLFDNSMPEPHRMKQLLIWCFKKKMDQENSRPKKGTPGDRTISNIAKVIKEEVMEDLSNGDINTGWYYSRNDNENRLDGEIANKEIVLPNPLNQETAKNVALYKKQLAKLRREKQQWNNLLSKHTTAVNKKIDNILQPPEITPEKLGLYKEKDPNFKKDVLDGGAIKELESARSNLHGEYFDNLENSVDKLHNLSHKLTKVVELFGDYKDTKLNQQLAELTKKYINKDKFENLKAQVDTVPAPLWPIPTKPLTVKELLRGISKLQN